MFLKYATLNLSMNGLKGIFLNYHNEIKYAIVGRLYKHFHYQAVALVKDKNDTCHQMFPTETFFFPEPFYFQFASAVALSLQRGLSLLQVPGFLQVLKAAQDFRYKLIAVFRAKPLAVKYENELTYEDLENIKLKQNLITLGNIRSVLYA